MKKSILIIVVLLLSTNILKCDWGGFGSLVSITSVDNLNGSYATLTSQMILISGDPQVSVKGLVWSASPNPDLSSYLGKSSQGPSSQGGPLIETYQTVISGLELNTTYYIRPYVINSDGTYLGPQITITTSSIPTLPEWGLILLTAMFAGLGGWFVWKRVA